MLIVVDNGHCDIQGTCLLKQAGLSHDRDTCFKEMSNCNNGEACVKGPVGVRHTSARAGNLNQCITMCLKVLRSDIHRIKFKDKHPSLKFDQYSEKRKT